jgi:hypothetical protein
MKLRHYILTFLTLTFIIACEREIEIELPGATDLIVVEGTIEEGKAPVILLTKNRGFFETFPTDLQTFVEEFVIQDAEIILNDGTIEETLQFTLDLSNYPFFYYTGSIIQGEVGKTYTLEIRANNQILTSSTTIPSAVPIDSTWFGLNPFDVDEDSLGVSYLEIMDPDTFGNAYRLFAKRNSEVSFFPVSGSSFNDDFVNGQKVIFFAGRGDEPFAATDTFVPNEFFYQLGDTMFMKLTSIGRKEFEFYSTLEAAVNSNGNPFASPTLVQSNVAGGLGVWVGSSSSYDTVIAVN